MVSVEGDGTATVTIGGDPEPVPGVASFSHYTPTAGDTVELEVQDTEVTILGTVGATAVATAQYAAVATSVARAAITYGALTGSAGPSVSATVGSSGTLEVVLSCEIGVTSDNDGGAVAVALSGANTVAASDAKAIKFFPGFIGALARMSVTAFFTGLTPGATTVTMQYKDLFDTGNDVTYANRELLVKPL